MAHKHGFGVDIGGSGIKGAPVDLHKGQLADDRFRIPTPQPATPEAVADAVGQILRHFTWDQPFGCTFPAVVAHGVVRTAANVDAGWIGTDGHQLLSDVTGQSALLVNDADAAGVAEARFGAARNHPGVVLMCTLGTGIGSALLVDGTLVPNTELGHLEIDGRVAESRAADSARERENLSWQAWAARLTRYFHTAENLFWPDLIVVGGGVSKKSDRWLHLVQTRAKIVPATLLNDAGIVGAAVLAADRHTAD
jgi:polyphosphate glucokinase